MDEQPIEQTEVLTDTKVRVKVPSTTKMAIAIAFLGIAAIAAAGTGIRESRLTQSRKVAEVPRATVADMAYNHASDYAKENRQGLTHDEFWEKYILTSNIFLSDAINFAKANSSKENYISSALNSMYSGDVNAAKDLYETIYSGHNSAQEKKQAWMFIMEKRMKEMVLADSEFSVVYDYSATGGDVRVSQYNFNKEVGLINPILFKNIIETLKQDVSDVGTPGASGSAGGLPSGAMSGGSTNGVTGGAANMLGCAEGQGKTGDFGSAGGGGNQAGMNSGQDSGWGGVDGSPDLTPDFDSNPFEGCGPGFNTLNILGGGISESVPEPEPEPESELELGQNPDAISGGTDSDDSVGGDPAQELTNQFFDSGTAGQALKWLFNSNQNWNKAQKGLKKYVDSAPGLGGPPSSKGVMFTVVTWGGKNNDPEGDSSNSNNCGPGFFSFLGGLDCGDDDSVCGGSDIGMVSTPSNSYINPCGDLDPAYIDHLKLDKQEFRIGYSPIDFVANVNLVGGQQIITDFMQVK